MAKLMDEIYAQAIVHVKTQQEAEVSVSRAIDELLAILGPGSFRDMIKSYDEQWRDRRFTESTTTEGTRRCLAKALNRPRRV